VRLVCDAGAFVALERNDRAMWRRLKGALHASEPPVSHGGVVAQVWRGGGGRQALLARALAGVEVVGLDGALGRDAGLLLGRSRVGDAIDAAVVALAAEGDLIVTSDPDDIRALVSAAGVPVDVIAV
jgi:hypothetical protein